MARVSISEAARLTGKSRTTLHRLIKAGDLSTCSGERNAKMVDTSELLRVFGPFEQPKGEHHSDWCLNSVIQPLLTIVNR